MQNLCPNSINESKIKEKNYHSPIDTEKKFSAIRSNPIFRSSPLAISEEKVQEMIINNDFYDKNRNEKGCGFNTHFEVLQLNGDKVIFNHTSGLMWQQHGSLEPMPFEAVKFWITELNAIGYANYHNWRLPTLEEAMSLMKGEKKNDGLFNDKMFGKRQSRIWTSDINEHGNLAWVVFFNYGSCYVNCLDLNNYIRAVRLA